MISPRRGFVVGTVLLALAVAGCEITGTKKPDVNTAAVPEPAKPAPPPPPPRPTLAEIDARLKLLVRLRRFHEAGEFHDENADLIKGKPEFVALLKQVGEGLNRQYDAPLTEAATSLAKYQRQRIAPDQMGKAAEVISAAKESLREYQSMQLVQILNLTSPAAKRLGQALEKTEGKLRAAEAVLRAPDPRLLRLVAEKKLEDAGRLYRAEAGVFMAAKPAGPGLRAFAAAQVAAKDGLLNEGAAALKAASQPSVDPATWPAAASAFGAVRKVLATYSATPPFDIVSLRAQKFRTLETSLATAERGWLARAPDALLAYAHGSRPDFVSAYPVAVTLPALAERWAPSAEAGLQARPLADLRALNASLGQAAPPKARDMLKRVIAKAEKAAAPVVVAKAAPAPLPGGLMPVVAGASQPQAAAQPATQPSARPAVIFVDSDR